MTIRFGLPLILSVFLSSHSLSQECDELERQYANLKVLDRSEYSTLQQINNLLISTSGDSCDLEYSYLYRLKGNCELKQNQKSMSFSSFKTSLKYAIASGDQNSIGYSQNLLGKVYSWDGVNDSALYFFNSAKEIFTSTSNSNGLLICFQNLAATYYYLDSLDDARTYSHKLLELAVALDDKEAVATGTQILNLIDIETEGVSDSTFLYYRRSLEVFRRLDDVESIMGVYENMGLSYQEIKQYDSAIYYFKKASVLADSMNSTHHLALMNSNVTNVGALLEETNRNKTLQIYILYGLIAFAIVLVFILIHLRRQKLIIKDKRINELLKEQEIQAIEAMLTGQDNERKRIAEELHDRLGGMLATIKLHYSKLDREISSQNEQLKVQYDKAGNLLDETVEEVRRISHDLYSGVLMKFGLKAAIEQLAEALEDIDKPSFNWHYNNVDKRFDNELEINVYRIVQESVGNILKHADANEVTVQLNLIEDHLNVMIEDNGKGFDSKQTRGSGIGLENIKNRAKRVKGNLEIDSTPGYGTTITIDIPVNYG